MCGVWVGDEYQCIILLIPGLIYLIILLFDSIYSVHSRKFQLILNKWTCHGLTIELTKSR